MVSSRIIGFIFFIRRAGRLPNNTSPIYGSGRHAGYDFGKNPLPDSTQRDQCCHSAGSLFMHTNGDLYISAGDNTNPFNRMGSRRWMSSQAFGMGLAKIRLERKRPPRKILRIHPQPDGTYTIPSGNLFPPGTPLTRPEIYVMGCRNPFRMAGG